MPWHEKAEHSSATTAIVKDVLSTATAKTKNHDLVFLSLKYPYKIIVAEAVMQARLFWKVQSWLFLLLL